MKYFALVLAGTLASSLPISALAERGVKGNGNAGGHTTVVIDDNGLSLECPPGLINRDPACVPPGQANHGATTADTIDSIEIRIGEHMSSDEFVYLEELGRWGLSPTAAGERYAIIDGNIVLINNETFELLQLVRRAVHINN